MMHSNKKPNKYIMIIICITFSLSMFYIATNAVVYTLNKKKVEDFSESILNKSILLMKEINFAISKSNNINESATCSKEHINKLREILWPQKFIKDIAYINKDMLLCTALWGDDVPPEKLSNNYKSVEHGKGLWLLGVNSRVLGGENIYVINNLAIMPSPFLFTRFTLESTNNEISAIVSDVKYQAHIFFIGNNTSDIYRMEHETHKPIGYIITKKCNHEFNLCATSGMYSQSFFDIPKIIIVLLSLLSLTLGILIYVSINLFLSKKDTILFRLNQALRTDKLSIVYQPILSIKENKVIGVEALLRWYDTEYGQVSPDVFIPIAEKHGIISHVTKFVMFKSIRETHELINTYKIDLSININSYDLFSSLFKENLAKATNLYKVSPSTITLELTERQSVNISLVNEHLVNLRSLGYKIALDDFGTGHSNLDWLSHLEVDKIKIDRFITNSIGKNSINSRILNKIISILSETHNQIIFEGIETEGQHSYLEANIPNAYAQGYFYAKPMNIEELRKYLDKKLNLSSRKKLTYATINKIG
ncbi:TPA: EAL domain-containing protein [Klebsiella quasipneumoniae]